MFWTKHVARIEIVNVYTKMWAAAWSPVTRPMFKFKDNNIKIKLTSVELWNPRRDRKNRKLENFVQRGFRDLRISPNIITVIKYMRIRWVGHVARMEKKTKFIQTFVRKNSK